MTKLYDFNITDKILKTTNEIINDGKIIDPEHRQSIIEDIIDTVAYYEDVNDSDDELEECQWCGCCGEFVASFTVYLNSGEKLSCDDLFFDNIVSLSSINKEFIEKIFNHYGNVDDINIGIYCARCLNCV